MLFYKWIGGFLLLFCSVCVGLSQIGVERARLARAKGYLALLRHIRRQIECYSLPVGDILARAEPRLLAACGWQGGAPPDFSALLSATAEGLGGEARGELSAFAERLFAEAVDICHILGHWSYAVDYFGIAVDKLDAVLCVSMNYILLKVMDCLNGIVARYHYEVRRVEVDRNAR